jgi:hypothetical protein
MTKKEATIVSAYTGYMLGDFSDMHEYVEKIMKRPVFTHELGNKKFCEEIQEKAKEDFISIKVEK